MLGYLHYLDHQQYFARSQDFMATEMWQMFGNFRLNPRSQIEQGAGVGLLLACPEVLALYGTWYDTQICFFDDGLLL